MNTWKCLSRGTCAGHIEGPEVEEPSPETLLYSNVLNLGEYGFQGVPTHNTGLDQDALVCDRKLRASPCEIAMEQDTKRDDEDENRKVWIESLVHRTCREGNADQEEKHWQEKHLPMQVSTEENLLA